jgi:hypothetical protein
MHRGRAGGVAAVGPRPNARKTRLQANLRAASAAYLASTCDFGPTITDDMQAIDWLLDAVNPGIEPVLLELDNVRGTELPC